jgi:hypothetical protein
LIPFHSRQREWDWFGRGRQPTELQCPGGKRWRRAAREDFCFTGEAGKRRIRLYWNVSRGRGRTAAMPPANAAVTARRGYDCYGCGCGDGILSEFRPTESGHSGRWSAIFDTYESWSAQMHGLVRRSCDGLWLSARPRHWYDRRAPSGHPSQTREKRSFAVELPPGTLIPRGWLSALLSPPLPLDRGNAQRGLFF